MRLGLRSLTKEGRDPKQEEERPYHAQQPAYRRDPRQEGEEHEAEQDHRPVLVHDVDEAAHGAWQEREDHLRAVERRDRDQVEDEQQGVDERHPQYAEEEEPALKWLQPYQDGTERDYRQVRCGTGEGDGHRSPHAAPELRRLNRNGAAPPETDHQERQAPQQVQVRRRVES